MIPRYTRAEMAAIWAPDHRLRLWLEIELCALEAMAEIGQVPREAALKVRAAAERHGRGADRSGAGRGDRADTRHDVIAFLTHVEQVIGAEARYLHLGMTSSDLLDTALALQLRAAADLLLGRPRPRARGARAARARAQATPSASAARTAFMPSRRPSA